MMKIEIDTNEINLILQGLAKLPYEKVALLIPKLQSQAQQQIEHHALEHTTEWHQTTT